MARLGAAEAIALGTDTLSSSGIGLNGGSYSSMPLLLGHRKSQLYPFEARVIEAIKSRLDSDGATQLQLQVDSINKVQRHTEGKEVNLYRIAGGKPAFDDSLRFAGGAEEAILATVRLTHPDRAATLKADAWLANGRLFSLLFDKPPKRFFAGHNIDSIRPEIADVTVWLDPMRETGRSETGEAPVAPAMLAGWLRDLSTGGRLTISHAPVQGPQRAELIAQIDAQLPLEYLELTEQMDGALIGACKIHGLASIRKVVLADANYYILVEIDDAGALAVKDGNKGGELYRLRYDRDDVQQLSQSFRTALTEFCCKSEK